MAIRNSQELGDNLFLIARRLADNNNLCRLLINTDFNPLSTPVENTAALLNKNILVVPRVDERDFHLDSKIAILFNGGNVNNENDEFKDLQLNIMIFCPFDSWIINSNNLRPFMIMSEIEKSLKNKRINGIGVLKYTGFELTTVTDDTSCYTMTFEIDVFN